MKEREREREGNKYSHNFTARGKIQFENLHFENPLTRFAVYQIIRNILNNTRYT